MKTPKLEQRGTPIQVDPQKGETIEMKVRRITQNKEPITDVAQPIYMERGVKMASCDIRTDRWEVAREAKDKVTAAISEKYQKRAEATASGAGKQQLLHDRTTPIDIANITVAAAQAKPKTE